MTLPKRYLELKRVAPAVLSSLLLLLLPPTKLSARASTGDAAVESHVRGGDWDDDDDDGDGDGGGASSGAAANANEDEEDAQEVSPGTYLATSTSAESRYRPWVRQTGGGGEGGGVGERGAGRG
jgi:hypothetical protein